MRARRALRIYYLLSFIFYLLSILPRRGTLVPDGAPIRNIPGNYNKKNSLTSPVNLYLPFISPGTLPRPKNAPPGRFCPAVRKTRGAGCSRPRWCTDPQHPGKLQQKNSLTFSVRLYFGALCLGLSRGLTKPHWGFVVGRYARRPTRPVLVPDGAPVRNILGNRNKKTPRNFLRGVYFGAPSGTRTQDPLIKSQLLSLVAHTHGVCRCNKKHFSNYAHV